MIMKLKDISKMTHKSERTVQRWIKEFPQELGRLTGKAKEYSREEVISLLNYVGEEIPEGLYIEAPSTEITTVDKVVEAEIVDLPSLHYQEIELNEDRHNKVLESYQGYQKDAEGFISRYFEDQLLDGLKSIERDQKLLLERIRAQSLGKGFQNLSED